MGGRGGGPTAGVRGVLDGDEVREILRETFFSQVPPAPPVPQVPQVSSPPEGVCAEPPARATGRGRKRAVTDPNGMTRPRPDHYKVICVSMYNEDLDRLDEMVRELKRRGYTKANRSAVLRLAIEHIDLSRVRRGL